jgi:uncharacterized membrane protein YjjP (DUF1212 family)
MRLNLFFFSALVVLCSIITTSRGFNSRTTAINGCIGGYHRAIPQRLAMKSEFQSFMAETTQTVGGRMLGQDKLRFASNPDTHMY